MIPFRLPSYRHQAEEFDLHRADRSRALLWQMRTGKTKAVIDLACHLFLAQEIRGVLVIAPNGVHRQWVEQELDKHLWTSVEANRFAWRFSEPRNKTHFADFMMINSMPFQNGMRWLAINMEALIRDEVRRAIAQFIRQCGGRVLAVYDESHHFARPGAKRTAVARGIARQVSHVRMLTGTESENSPLQSFSQYELMDREALGFKTYGDFKKRYAIFEDAKTRGGQRFQRLVAYQNLDELKARKARYSSVVLRSDCEDLPPLQMDRRVVELTTKQAKMWKDVKEQEIEALEALGRDEGLYGGAALVKLQQIEGGFWLNADGSVLDVAGEANPKMLILIDEITQYDGQVLVWFQFVHEIEAARERLAAAGVTAGMFHGRAKHRDRDLTAFQAGRLRVMLAQPQAGGEGRSFPAGLMIWYSATPDAVVRSQALERGTIMGGKSVQVVDLAAPGGVDDRWLRLTADKSLRADDMSRDGLRALKELSL